MSKRIFNPAERAEAEAKGEVAPPSFPAECLPPILRRMAEGVAELQRVPVAMTAPMVLAVASASLGRGVCMEGLLGNNGWPNLFVVVCAESGTGKSSAFRLVTAPLFGMQARILRQFRSEELPQLEAEKAALTIEMDSAKARFKKAETDTDRHAAREDMKRCTAKLKAVEDSMRPPLLLTSDSTPESLIEQLAANNEALAQFNPDAADAFDTMMGCYRDKNSRQGSSSPWLKLFNHEGFATTRTNRGNIVLDSPSLAMLLVVTPNTARRHLEDKSQMENGFLGRLLLCDPKAVMSGLTFEEAQSRRSLNSDVREPYEAAIWKALAVYHRPRGLENEDWFPDDDEPDYVGVSDAQKQGSPPGDEKREPFLIQLSKDALRVLTQDWNRQVVEWNGASQDRELVARETEMASRLALVMHIFAGMECAAGGQGGTWKVTSCRGHLEPLQADTMRNAVRIRDWFKASLANMMAGLKETRRDDLFSKIEGLIIKSKLECVTPRDLLTRGMAKTSEAAKDMLDAFVKDGRLHCRQREAKGTGRPPGAAYFLPTLERRMKQAGRHLT